MNTAITHLSDEQLHDLVTYITEDCGSGLDQDSFADALLSMLADVAGMESLTEQQAIYVVDAAFKLYTQTI